MAMVKSRLAKRRNVKLPDVDEPMFFDEISSRGGAKWLVELLESDTFQKECEAQGLPPLKLFVERIREAANSRLEQGKLADVETSVSQMAGKGGFLGFKLVTMESTSGGG